MASDGSDGNASPAVSLTTIRAKVSWHRRRPRSKFGIHDVLFFLVVCNFSYREGAAAFTSTSCQRPGRRLRLSSNGEETRAFPKDGYCEDYGSHSISDLADECDSNSKNSIDYHYSASASCSNKNTNMVVSRRVSLAASALGLVAALVPTNPGAASASSGIESDNQSYPTIPSLTIPLQYQPNLSAYTISYKVGSSQFGAIIDTGSPFLFVPASSKASCRPEYRWGCFRPEESRPAAGLGPTMERFDGNEGLVEWREGKFSFDVSTTDGKEINSKKGGSDVSLSLPNPAAANAADSVVENAPSSPSDESLQSILFPQSLMTFGVISESLMDGPGGIFLGLVKNTDKRIRPSFLGQSDVSAFSVDLREREEGMPKTLTLYGGSADGKAKADAKSKTTSLPIPSNEIDYSRTRYNGLLNTQNAIPLVRDLNKRFGDPTIHYVGVASSITANGFNLASSQRNSKIYCIFDTGCSGMSISPGLFDERYAAARARKEKNLWGTVDVELKTMSGETVTLNAKRPITTPLGSERPWGKKLDGHLIVLGLAFLEGVRMTVDIDGGSVWFED